MIVRGKRWQLRSISSLVIGGDLLKIVVHFSGIHHHAPSCGWVGHSLTRLLMETVDLQGFWPLSTAFPSTRQRNRAAAPCFSFLLLSLPSFFVANGQSSLLVSINSSLVNGT
ncbi:hypothetical protein BJY01DRAFT_60480 [Aspergillus pseudoustus]|uniref:Uncharacterized protein n=1 Tax=Aspergillus pseudoustus TaxID=1810923 RepID=A0ABR4J869_9EURO